MDFSWTWYENMKNVRDIVAKPITSDFFVGFRPRDSMEGMLRTKLDRKQKMTKVDFAKCFYHYRTVSVIHQKLPTFN